MTDITTITAELVSAYVANNPTPASELPTLIASISAAFQGLGQPTQDATADPRTPYEIRKSITADALISFIDGKPYKTLKRHLTCNGLSFDEYRARYGLPRDYPTVAANYAAQRSQLARDLGLGRVRRKAPKQAQSNAQSDDIAIPPAAQIPARRATRTRRAAAH